MRFTKGKHAFTVSTHTDKAHIHNHIYFNSTTLDGTKKFRNFWLSGIALQRVSDLICLENGLSVIEKKSYRDRKKHTEYPKKETFRDGICTAIDVALAEKPKDFEELLKLLEQAFDELGLKFSDFEQHTVKIERQLGACPVMEERSSRHEKFLDDAMESSPKVNPPEIVSMDELMEGMYREQFEMMGYSENQIEEMLEDMPHSEIPMIVVTNTDRVNGAAVLFYNDVMDEIGEKLNGNFFVLPSSLHETIVVGECFGRKEK